MKENEFISKIWLNVEIFSSTIINHFTSLSPFEI